MTNFLCGWMVMFWLGKSDAWNWIFLWGKTLDNVYWRGRSKKCIILVQFLGAFAKLRTATISFIISGRPHRTTRFPLDRFSWNLIFEDFSRFVEKIRLSLKSDKNNGYFYEDLCTFMISVSILLRKRNVLEEIWRENQNSHFVFNNFYSANRAVYEMMWENSVEPDRTQMTI